MKDSLINTVSSDSLNNVMKVVYNSDGGEEIIVFFFAFILIGIISYFYYKIINRRLLNEVILKAIEKGVDIPFQSSNYFLRGLILSFLGAAISIAFLSVELRSGLTLGLPILGLGLAYLIYTRYTKTIN